MPETPKNEKPTLSKRDNLLMALKYLMCTAGAGMPSSLTTLLPLALESSSYLPVSVCGTGTAEIHTAFLAIFHPGLRY